MGPQLELQESLNLLDGVGRLVWLQQRHANTAGSKCPCAVVGLRPWKVTDGGGVQRRLLCGLLTGTDGEARGVRDAEPGGISSTTST